MRIAVGYVVIMTSIVFSVSSDGPSCKDLRLDKLLEHALDKLKETQGAEELIAKAVKFKRENDPAAARVFAFLRSTQYIKTMGFGARVQLNALQELRNILNGTDVFAKAKECFGDTILDLEDLLEDAQPDTTYRGSHWRGRQLRDRYKYCQMPKRFNCYGHTKYRTFDGSCNNRYFPNRGKANRAFARFLEPDYADDIEAPRKASDGGELPSARDISLKVFQNKVGYVSGVHTQLVMGIGQYLDHDITHTPVSKLLVDDELVDVDCGTNGCETEGPGYSECFPIPVGADDTCFQNKSCLMFVRSQEYMKDGCDIGPREQSNTITAYVDASQVYGSSLDEVKELAVNDPHSGEMKTSPHPLNTESVKYRDLLPTHEDSACRGITDTVKCFLAGDSRVNEQIGLTSLHTVWVRMHNVVVKRLRAVRNHWDRYELFQVARKIVSAMWQNIVYNEFLPVVLGPGLINRYALQLTNGGDEYKGYNVMTNSDIRNEFATAAFRFGHSLIGDFMNLTDHTFTQKKSIPLVRLFFNPTELYNLHFNTTTGVDAALLGQLKGRSDPCDRFFTPEVTTKLFAEGSGKGTDLTALNIQRGRDHGVPGYTKFLELCGDDVPKDFNELKYMDTSTKEKLADIYKHVDDIDFFVGGISEKSMDGGIVGPTFGCVIGHQFNFLRKGDRFWFEGERSGFSREQRASIKKFTLSKLFCETLDKVETIQKYALLQPKNEAAAFMEVDAADMYKFAELYKGTDNERRPCEELPDIDYDLWKPNKRPSSRRCRFCRTK